MHFTTTTPTFTFSCFIDIRIGWYGAVKLAVALFDDDDDEDDDDDHDIAIYYCLIYVYTSKLVYYYFIQHIYFATLTLTITQVIRSYCCHRIPSFPWN